MGGVRVFYHHQRWADIPVNDPTAESVYYFSENYMDSFSQLVLIMAAFAALFLGTEFSQRTIRNKVAIGHSKVSVYFSSLLTCAAGSLIINLAYAAGVTVMGVIFGGRFGVRYTFFEEMLIVIAADIALSAVLTLFCMLIGNKALCTAAVLIVFFVTPFIAESIDIAVHETEYNIRREYNDDRTSYAETKVKNEKYLTGAKRFVYTALNNVSPLGQYEQLENGEIYDIFQYTGYPLCSLGLTAAVSAVGAVIFRRKNLK